MTKYIHPISRALITGLLLAPICGCGPGAKSKSSVSITVAGREIAATWIGPAGTYPDANLTAVFQKGGSANGPLAVWREKDGAVIQFGTHQISAEKQRVTLDGKDCAQIPTNASRMHFSISQHSLVIKADGIRIKAVSIAP